MSDVFTTWCVHILMLLQRFQPGEYKSVCGRRTCTKLAGVSAPASTISRPKQLGNRFKTIVDTLQGYGYIRLWTLGEHKSVCGKRTCTKLAGVSARTSTIIRPKQLGN